jgi:uncharacterized pyridoxal phosphate-containing UPF0001 family protein
MPIERKVEMVEPEVAMRGHITLNLARVRARMVRSARDAGRSPESISLVCVTKGQDQNRIRAALEAGERVFGENRVQEAQSKWPSLRREYSTIELHLIGPLQTNKVLEAIALFDVIETLDRPRLAEATISFRSAGPPAPYRLRDLCAYRL